MDIKTCPACGNQSFEIVTAKPLELKHQILVVQCNACKHVIGTLRNDEKDKVSEVLFKNRKQE